MYQPLCVKCNNPVEHSAIESADSGIEVDEIDHSGLMPIRLKGPHRVNILLVGEEDMVQPKFKSKSVGRRPQDDDVDRLIRGEERQREELYGGRRADRLTNAVRFKPRSKSAERPHEDRLDKQRRRTELYGGSRSARRAGVSPGRDQDRQNVGDVAGPPLENMENTNDREESGISLIASSNPDPESGRDDTSDEEDVP